MIKRQMPAEWSGEEYGLPFPDGAPLTLRGQLQAGSRDASLRLQWGSSPALHVVVASGGYPAAACDRRILIDATAVIDAAEARPGGRCRRPACAGLFATAEPLPARTTPGGFRCGRPRRAGRFGLAGNTALMAVSRAGAGRPWPGDPASQGRKLADSAKLLGGYRHERR
jgi:hypothetical protein